MLKSPVKTFVIMAAVFGSLVITLTPPFTGADEEAHFTRAYSITTGDLVLHDTSHVSVPKSLRQTIGCFQTKTSEPGVMYRYNYSNYGISKKLSFSCALSLPLDQNNTEKIHTSAFAYSPVAYLPQVMTLTIGKLLHLPIIVMAYLIRFSVLIEYIFLIALAIKLLPVRKWALAGIALLPTPIMFINNPGGDYVLLGSIAIITAVVIRSIYIPTKQLNKENRRLLVILAIFTFTAILSKGIFPAACLLPLLAFYGGFLRYKKYQKLAIVVSALILALLWQKFGVNQGLASQVVAPSILEFPKALVQTVLYRWVDTDFLYTGDFVGNTPLNGEHLGMPSIVITLINFLFLAYIAISYPEKQKLQKNKHSLIALKITALFCAASIIIGSFAALFIGAPYLQLGSGTIKGVGVRYLYPAFFILAAIPLTHRIRASELTVASIVTLGSIVCLSSLILVEVIKYHWLHF